MLGIFQDCENESTTIRIVLYLVSLSISLFFLSKGILGHTFGIQALSVLLVLFAAIIGIQAESMSSKVVMTLAHVIYSFVLYILTGGQ